MRQQISYQQIILGGRTAAIDCRYLIQVLVVLFCSHAGQLGKDIPDAKIHERIEAQRPGQACSLIYTSGTTGPPKAAMVSHDNITWTCHVSTLLPPNLLARGVETLIYRMLFGWKGSGCCVGPWYLDCVCINEQLPRDLLITNSILRRWRASEYKNIHHFMLVSSKPSCGCHPWRCCDRILGPHGLLGNIPKEKCSRENNETPLCPPHSSPSLCHSFLDTSIG